MRCKFAARRKETSLNTETLGQFLSVICKLLKALQTSERVPAESSMLLLISGKQLHTSNNDLRPPPPPLWIQLSALLVGPVKGLLVINRFRKAEPPYYSRQSVNKRCNDRPLTLEGSGTVPPLSGGSVCGCTMAEEEREEGGGVAGVAEQQRQTAARHVVHRSRSVSGGHCVAT